MSKHHCPTVPLQQAALLLVCLILAGFVMQTIRH
jgi:hypothetical protein